MFSCTAVSRCSSNAINRFVWFATICGRRIKDAWAYGKISVLCGTAIMSTLAVLLFLFPNQLVGLFTQDPDVIRLAVTTLRVYVWSLPFFAVSIVSAGAMRGAGDTRVPFYYAMAGMWGLRLPLAVAAVFILHLGLPAVWIAMALDLTFRGLVMGRRFIRRSWMTASKKGK